MLEIPQIGEFYKHYNGNVYRIIACPKYASTGGKISGFDSNGAIVWYQDIKTQQVWRKTLKDFLEPKVLDDSTVVKRFELIKNGANSAAKTARLPLTRDAMFKLALSLQELSQESKEGCINLKMMTENNEEINLVFVKNH